MLLGSIVQIALDAASFNLERGDDFAARIVQFLDLAGDILPEPQHVSSLSARLSTPRAR
ncbi:hypothetical protein [Trueperella pyogenes]|uniref:hypothetical protein n=1 Tax=Trueperella pyogenes TaxID=1661 RepID=UPI003DA9C8DC